MFHVNDWNSSPLGTFKNYVRLFLKNFNTPSVMSCHTFTNPSCYVTEIRDDTPPIVQDYWCNIKNSARWLMNIHENWTLKYSNLIEPRMIIHYWLIISWKSTPVEASNMHFICHWVKKVAQIRYVTHLWNPFPLVMGPWLDPPPSFERYVIFEWSLMLNWVRTYQAFFVKR